MCACVTDHIKYPTICNPRKRINNLFLIPFKDMWGNDISNKEERTMDNTTLNAKVNMMQTQMAMMSLTVASMQAHIKELEAEIDKLKNGIVVREEPNDLSSIPYNLSVDDNDSDGYDTDDQLPPPLVVETSQPQIQQAVGTPFVMIDYESDSSGYDTDE